MKRNQTAFMKLCLADALIKLMAAQDYDSINFLLMPSIRIGKR